jgi:S-formylglutathione hydrolase FrmB
MLLVVCSSFAQTPVWADDPVRLDDPTKSDPITPGKPTCQIHQSTILRRTIRYCLFRLTPETESLGDERVVYFMHGIYGSSSTFEDSGYLKALQTVAAEGGAVPTTFVTFDTEGTSFFSDEGGRNAGPRAFDTWFVQEFVPMIEKNFPVCRDRSCRAIGGLSMGGFGAIKTAFKYPHLFFRVGANSPALPPFSVWEPTAQWQSYFSRHPIGPVAGLYLLGQVRRVFSTPQLFDENDPVGLASRLSRLGDFPEVYWDMGGRDDFGFEEGHVKLQDALNQSGIPFQSVLVPGADHYLFRSRNIDLVRYLTAI